MERAAMLRLGNFFNLFLAALGVAIVVVSVGYGFASLARPGPGLYPVFLGYAIAVCAWFVLVGDLRAGSGGHGPDRSAGFTLFAMTTTFSFWILAMPLLGYVLVTLLAVFSFGKIMRLEGWRKPLALSVGTALFIYVLFDHWLYVDLPRGLLG